MKPVLKAPGSPLLKLSRDGPLSNFTFKFHLLRYNMVELLDNVDQVGRCRLTL